MTINRGFTLSLGSGAVLLRNTSAVAPAAINSGTGSGTATLNLGSEGFLFSNFSSGINGNAIATRIAATSGVAISGPANSSASLILNPGADGNTYTGGTYLNGANLSISVQGTNSLGDPSSPLNVVGGAISGAGVTIANPVNSTAQQLPSTRQQLPLQRSR